MECWVAINFLPLEIKTDVLKYVLSAGNMQSNGCKIPAKPNNYSIL